MSEETSAQSQSGVRTELARDMGLMHVVMIGIGAMIGAGIFVLTGTAAATAGPALILVFLLNGVVTTLTALSYAELGSCFPEAGGGYLWVKQALPQPSGFLSGWMSWFAHAVACSLYAVAFGSFLTELINVALGFDLAQLVPFVGHGGLARILAVVVIAAFCWVNYRGAGETGFAETVVTVIKMVIIGLFILFGLALLLRTTGWMEQLTPFVPDRTLDQPGPNGTLSVPGWLGIIAAMGLTFIAFEGYEIIAQCGEEVKAPKRNIPRAIFISLAVVVPVYMLVAFVAITAVPDTMSGGEPNWLWLGRTEHTELAMAGAANAIFPWSAANFGKIVFLLGGLFSTMSALNATVYSSARVSFAMGRDHNLPAFFARIHPTRRTPHGAIWTSGLLIAVVAVALPVEDLASATDVMFLFLFILVNLSVINLRRHRPDLDRGFRVPWVPVLPLVALTLNLFLAAVLFYEIPLGSYVSGAYIVVGIAVYLLYARKRELEAKATPIVYEAASPAREKKRRLLVPLANPSNVEKLMGFAGLLAKRREASLVAMNVLNVPSLLPPSTARQFTESRRRLLDDATAYEDELGVSIRAVLKVGHSVTRAVLEATEQYDAESIVIGWRGQTRARERIFGSTIDELFLSAEADVIMVREPPQRPPQRILVPVAGIRPARLSLDVALAVQAWAGCPILVLHVAPQPDRVDALREHMQERLDKLLGDLTEQTAPPGEVELKVIAADKVANAIIHAVRDGDFLILGAPREGLLQRAVFGDIPRRVLERVEVPAVLTKQYVGRVASWFQKLFGRRRSQLFEDDAG